LPSSVFVLEAFDIIESERCGVRGDFDDGKPSAFFEDGGRGRRSDWRELRDFELKRAISGEVDRFVGDENGAVEMCA
jgi:hypothetical protein